ncbi:Alpha/Beta hydrolase protein [Nemania diffusa]|nr:Alpha/Beta hydrolase protein [Nemania diffusa]
MASHNSTPEPKSFGPTHIIDPVQEHTHTVVFLHGRGSSGDEFAEELFDSSSSSSSESLTQQLPNWRWVFPSSRELWSATFQEYLPAWFEAPSLTDVTASQELQAPGIRDAVRHVRQILDGEIERLGGRAERVFLAGISQGGAIAMWTLLCHSCRRGGGGGELGGLVLASAWLPFAAELERFHASRKSEMRQDGAHDEVLNSRKAADDCGWHGASAFVRDMLAETTQQTLQSQALFSQALSTPVFFGHGVDDAYVDVALGRQAADVLGTTGYDVVWTEYSGAEQEGHWFKVPDEVVDIVAFLQKHA